VGGGSAEAWDLKFLTAKFLFCAGFGLLIFKLFKSRPLSLMYAALAAYCGAFFYIDNHLVFFVFAYAPWILFSAMELLELQSNRHLRWGLVWLLANYGCFNAGHVETAAVLISGLNLVALILALTFCRSYSDWLQVLGRMAAGTLLFLGLTAPLWVPFLAALPGSFSTHMRVQAFQLPFGSLLGAFDDMFYLMLRSNDTVAAAAPGSSFLVLVGCVLSVLAWRQLKKDRFFWINGVASVFWAACIFGVVPASLLEAVPLLNRVGHTHTDFSFLLIIHLTIQSAYGFKSLADANNLRLAVKRLAGVIVVLAGMLLLYCHGRFDHQPIPWNYLICVTVGAVGAPLSYVFLKSRPRPISAVGWVGIIVLGFIPQFRFGLYNVGDDKILMRPAPRAVLNAPSPSVDKMQADKSGVYRVVGMNYNFYGNYAAVYGLEDIRSCAPLSSSEYIDLVRNFPGITFGSGWVIELADPVSAQPLLNLLNVKYVLAPPHVRLQEGLDFKVFDRGDFGVLENLQMWPRAFFSDQVVPLASTSEFTQYLWKNRKQPFIALTGEEIDKQPGVQSLETTNPATVLPATNYELLPNSTAFDIHATSAGMVCLTEGAAKDFSVQVNHEPRTVLTVNRAFKGVYLDKAGDYHIEFIYRPDHWRLACSLFWLALSIAALLAAREFLLAPPLAKSRDT
jgi:hypothetical protein